MAAVLAWGDARFERTLCVIARDNAPAVALARRHGYRELGPAALPDDWTGPDYIEFARERPAADD